MLFEFITPTTATLTSVTPRTEVHGEDRVFAISLGLKLRGANTLLDKLSSTLRHALYMAVPDQDQLPGVEPSTPLLRSKHIEHIKIAVGALEGWTLAVDHGIDETAPIKVGGCKVDKFQCTPMEGGSVEVSFRISSNDIDATEAGLLCSHLSQEISFTLTAPEKKPDAIDGTGAEFKKDYQNAEDLFAKTGDPKGGESDTGSEGGETDAKAPAVKLSPEAAWPFPKGDKRSTEPPPQSTTVETRSPSGSRTARGREKTKAALKAAAAVAT